MLGTGLGSRSSHTAHVNRYAIAHSSVLLREMQTCLRKHGSVCFTTAITRQNILIVTVKPCEWKVVFTKTPVFSVSSWEDVSLFWGNSSGFHRNFSNMNPQLFHLEVLELHYFCNGGNVWYLQLSCEIGTEHRWLLLEMCLEWLKTSEFLILIDFNFNLKSYMLLVATI